MSVVTVMRAAAQVITDHAYDYDAGECMCGYRGRDLAGHLACELANAKLLVAAPVVPASCVCEPATEVGRCDC